jgi:hypothetical protein
MIAALKLRRASPVALAVLTFASLTPAIDHANAAPNNGGRGKVTCQGGREPGDIQTIHTYIYVNGNLVGQTTPPADMRRGPPMASDQGDNRRDKSTVARNDSGDVEAHQVTPARPSQDAHARCPVRVRTHAAKGTP